jgi:AP endonuclease-2
MLEAMDAEIICFQGESLIYRRRALLSLQRIELNGRNGLDFILSEHKSRRDNIDKLMAVPPHFDAFFSFPHGKGGYSGTCTYVRSSYTVPLKAEEGITGKLLRQQGMNSALPKFVYEDNEMVGGYVGDDEVEVMDQVDGTAFDVKKLDMEGRAVVLDFG